MSGPHGISARRSRRQGIRKPRLRVWPLLHDENCIRQLRRAAFNCSKMDAQPTEGAAMSERRELDAKACDALEAARLLPHGDARTKAMKEASRLRIAADKLRDAVS